MSLARAIITAIEQLDKTKYRNLIISAKKEDLIQSESFGGMIKISALQKAVEMGDIDAMHLILSKGIHVNTVFHDGNTAIHHIMLIKDHRIRNTALDFIIACGADINASANDELKMTPLHQCLARLSLRGYDETFDRLAKEKSLDVNKIDACGMAALDLVRKESDIASQLISAGAVPSNTVKNYNPREWGVMHSVDYRYERKMELATKTYHDACQLAIEAQSVAHTETGATAFQIAIKENNEEKIKKYLAMPFLPYVGDAALNTIYHYAAQYGKHAVIASLYKKFSDFAFKPFPAHFELQNINGDTCLHVAVQAGQIDCIEILLKLKCSYTIANNTGKTVLDLILANQALLEKLQHADIPQGLKNILPDKVIAENQVQFNPTLFSKKRKRSEVDAEMTVLHSTVTNGVIKSRKISPLVASLLNKKTPQTLEAYLKSLKETEAFKSAPMVAALIKEVEVVLEKMQTANTARPK